MKEIYPGIDKILFFNKVNCATSLLKPYLSTCLTPVILLGFGLVGSHASHALTPPQQAVMDYFTNPSVCTPVTSGGPAPIPDPPDGKKGKLSSGKTGNRIISEIPVVDPTGFECSNLVSPDGQTHFQSGIERLLNNPDSLDIDAALSGLAFEEVITMGTLNVEVNGAHMANLNAHLDDLHSGSIGMRQGPGSGRQLSKIKSSGGGASSSETNKKIGFFINTRVNRGDKDATVRETGFDFDAYGLTAGMDVRVNNGLVVGFAAGYGDTEAEYTTSIGRMKMTGYSLSAFGTLYQKDLFYFDGIINLTRNKFDSTRTFVTPNAVTQTALGETNGNVLTVGLGMGIENSVKDVSIGPFVRLNYTRVGIDGFSETGAGAVGMEVDKQKLSSFEGIFGFQASKIISLSWGVLVPQLRMEMVHEFKNESRVINARFLGVVENGINTTMKIPTDRPDRNYINLALGTSAQFSRGRTAYVQYQGLFAQQSVREHALELGVRWNY